MKLKHIFNAGLIGLVLLHAQSCRKSESLDVDMDRYKLNVQGDAEIDAWITSNMTTPYNIELVYRFERNLTDVARDIAPVKLEKVKPTAEAIINIFLKTYEKVAGSTFIRKYTPKQFVLYGSPSYNSNGTIVLGTADGGRRVVLYELNDLNFSDPAQVSRKMRTIHHEFTHILNQVIDIQPDFRLVTKSDYNEDWTATTNTAADAQKLGFVSRYARSSFTEDFAEMTAHLLIEGQFWFEAYAKAAGADGQAKLKKKEALVVDYFRQNFNINFRELQYEVAKVLTEVYNDQTKSFIYAIRNNQVTIPFNVALNDGPHYVEYGQSAQFAQVWQDVKDSLALGNRKPSNFNVVFLSATVMQVQQNYLSSANSPLVAWYDFNVSINADGDISFTRFDSGAGDTQYGNGRNTAVLKGYKPMLDYLESHVFRADWIPLDAGPKNYLRYGGFYVKDEPDNYFYGKF